MVRAVYATSRGISSQRRVRICLGGSLTFVAQSFLRFTPEKSLIVGWGRKTRSDQAAATAQRLGRAFLRLEDGFVCYAGHPSQGCVGLSLVLDDRGIYYDCRTPSRLEAILAANTINDTDRQRAHLLRHNLVAKGISKYNHAPDDVKGALQKIGLQASEPFVLVVDQTAGDCSIAGGLANVGSFARMLAAAQAENPHCAIVIKIHPDVLLGTKRGYLEHARGNGIFLLAADLNPIRLVQAAKRVYVVTSQLGFEALLCGTPVTCFGVPFYAGYGFTDDRCTSPRPRSQQTFDTLVAALYFRYCRYWNPITGRRCQIEEVLTLIDLQHRLRAIPTDRFVCLGFWSWKHEFIRRFLGATSEQCHFTQTLPETTDRIHDIIVGWGTKQDADLETARLRGCRILRIEDGFVRSVGLGSDFVAPCSLVLDDQGLYYDPGTPSRIESILASKDFSAAEIARGNSLAQLHVALRVSKYNLGGTTDIPRPLGKRRILVTGQVEDDASIRRGTLDITTNTGLLQTVRATNPDACIAFKTHPDVIAGNRLGRICPEVLQHNADLVVDHIDIVSAIEWADEVHVMTSQAGFEALLRQKQVVVYGLPFYAGWGLTIDRHKAPRRGRQRTLGELVHATLVDLPRYYDQDSGLMTEPEWIISKLANAPRAPKRPWWNRPIRFIRRMWRRK